MGELQLETLLPGAGAFGAFATAVVLLIKLLGHDRAQLVAADTRYKDEVAAHAKTDAELDEQRELRRKAEDAVADLARQVRRLTEQVAEQTETIARQTERIAHLEQNVARLTGAAT